MKYKLKYKYNFFRDLYWIYQTFKNKDRLLKKKLVVFSPSFKSVFSLWKKRPEEISINTKFPITLYWISSGTWGAFAPPDKIFVCPWKKDGGMYSTHELKKLILHEITHLYLWEETKYLSFAEREEIVNNRMKNKV